jgi:hypothetical protein
LVCYNIVLCASAIALPPLFNSSFSFQGFPHVSPEAVFQIISMDIVLILALYQRERKNLLFG